MVDVGAIRTGLQTQLETINGLRAYGVWPDTMNTPAALVKPLLLQFHKTLGSGPTLVEIDFEVTILAAPLQVGLARGQQALDAYLGTRTQSIKAALESDQSLSNSATGVVVTGWKDYGSLAVNDIEYLGAKFEVTVRAS